MPPWGVPLPTYHNAADHGMVHFQSDVNTQLQNNSAEGIDASVTDYVRADLLNTARPVKQEIELRQLLTITTQSMEHDTMTIATRSTVPVEWTTPDSSYGAAFPCCGCIPKKTRRIIELCLIAIGSFLFIYVLIKFSVIITTGSHKNDQNSTNSTGGGGSKYLETDDDFYVTNEYDDYNYRR